MAGALSMRVTPSPIEQREVQAYATDGLASLGQAEIVLAVARRAREPADPLDATIGMFFRTVHRLASEGRVVGVGGITELGHSGLIEPRFGGLVYADGAWATSVAATRAPMAVRITLRPGERPLVAVGPERSEPMLRAVERITALTFARRSRSKWSSTVSDRSPLAAARRLNRH